MVSESAPSAPPAALPPIPEGHPHATALLDLSKSIDAAEKVASGVSVFAAGVPAEQRAAQATKAASLRASYLALLASPSVVADAPPESVRRFLGEVDAARADALSGFQVPRDEMVSVVADAPDLRDAINEYDYMRRDCPFPGARDGSWARVLAALADTENVRASCVCRTTSPLRTQP